MTPLKNHFGLTTRQRMHGFSTEGRRNFAMDNESPKEKERENSDAAISVRTTEDTKEKDKEKAKEKARQKENPIGKIMTIQHTGSQKAVSQKEKERKEKDTKERILIQERVQKARPMSPHKQPHLVMVQPPMTRK